MAYTQISKKEALARAPIVREWLSRNDIQTMMGVSYEFLSKLTQRDDFPRPIGPMDQGELKWRRSDVVDFMASYEEEVSTNFAERVVSWRLSVIKQEKARQEYRERKARLAAAEPVRQDAEPVRA